MEIIHLEKTCCFLLLFVLFFFCLLIMVDLLRIGQWNIRGWTSGSLFHKNLNKIKTIEMILVDMKIDVLLVSEWLISERKWLSQKTFDKNRKKSLKINNILTKYEFFANSTCTGIIINKNLNYKKRWIKPSHNNKDDNKNSPHITKATLIDIEINNKWISLVSYYKSPSGKSNASDILKMYYPLVLSDSVLFGGDLNLRHLLFGDNYQNDESMEFIDSIDETDLAISPPPKPTHEKGGYLDILFMSPGLSKNITRHRICKSFKNIKKKLSDHFLQVVDFSLLHKESDTPESSNRWDTSNEIKQKNFRKSVGELLGNCNWRKMTDQTTLLNTIYKQ